MIGGGRDNTIRHNVIVEPGTEGIMYDERAREGQYEGGWWGTAAGKWQFSVLASSPYQNPAWKALFPELAQVIPYPEQTDKNDPSNVVNPAGSVIEGNVIYSFPRKAGYRISDGVTAFSDVGNNITSIYKTDFVSYKKGNYALRDSAKLYESIPDFGKIDFNSIGRKTS
jgi:hypothetical protein